MFEIDNEKTIHITRGDVANIDVTATFEDGGDYIFHTGDILRIKVVTKKDHSDVKVNKYVEVTEDTKCVKIFLDGEDTKIGEIINKPVDYWYEIELNPDTEPQTIVGYDDDGAKVFRLYPEGGEYNG